MLQYLKEEKQLNKIKNKILRTGQKFRPVFYYSFIDLFYITCYYDSNFIICREIK